ncbi:ferrochelatase [Emcibacter nanhaiensis]|uniref:Ferrochelatase n=1 Tax=Emcibacter nanhaiensis TaxID=1505037 RepID=A0A501PLL7_9PROT|nr:ferrochelatase [Emcibacter nanhaiensis]TPD61420.1 ferrochelatase [Emcibacter nanhaiensis]
MSEANKEKIAVVLFNLGGPDSLEAVKPFLYNLFYDPAIISVPNPLRWFLAKLISTRRAPFARDIYREIGNKSPLLEQTEDQARALEEKLNQSGTGDYGCFIAMRYWHPFSDEAVEKVKAFGPDRIILLPLYPQYSLTTTGSSLIDWTKKAKAAGLEVPSWIIREYPTDPKFIDAHVALIREALDKIDTPSDYRLLFSAHGLPKKVIEAGDPYQKQVEETCAAIIEKLGDTGLEYVTCYQSRVGPLEWIGPSTEDEIDRAGEDGKNLIIVPVAFVSEHSETLVELDIEYREFAEKAGVREYIRVPALQCQPDFIDGLAELVIKTAG